MREVNQKPPMPGQQSEAGTALSAAGLSNERVAIRGLFDSLESKGARYCHWKSNVRLDGTISGAEDIDLLADPRDAHLLQQAMLENGFKLACPRRGISHPALFHATALDLETARLVDLHAHYQVVSGDSYVKSYRFSIEGDLLEQTELLYGVRVPAPAAELALFVVRMLLKHVSPMEIRKANLHYEEITRELAWLRSKTDPDAAAAMCCKWFPSIDPAFFARMIDAVGNERALPRRILLGYQLAWRLRRMRRIGVLPAFVSRTWRLTEKLQRRRARSLQSGGAIVALVGAKGTGKSTIERELAKRLGRQLDVVRMHVGKPPATILSWLGRLFTPMSRRLLREERQGRYDKPERRNERNPSLFFTIRMLLLAYDRDRLLRRAHRLATAGTIVICDRFPSSSSGAPDSSQFDDLALARATSPLQRWLMEKERAIYRTMPKPRVVLRLFTPLETALGRDAERQKPGGPNPDAVRRRWTLENGAQFADTTVVDIDTDQPLEPTIRAAMQAVWNNL
jgi:thymidylate kinase